jgi:hypothetical protein
VRRENRKSLGKLCGVPFGNVPTGGALLRSGVFPLVRLLSRFTQGGKNLALIMRAAVALEKIHAAHGHGANPGPFLAV